ncbi:MAG: SMP-30/gluconolactonase/LRE family protein, partial [Myxococcales bacterium]|nr:SMP-30/gluconolactonase/LRE family protein [Myxococcales bacterium]
GTSDTTTATTDTTTTDATDSSDTGVDPVACTVDPSAEASKYPGLQDDGSIILVNGRRTDTLGESLLLTGLGADVILHPSLDVAYVTTAGRNQRHLYAIDSGTQAVLQDLDRGKGFFGLAISSDGSRLYASNGVPGGIEAFDIDAGGMLTSAGEVPAAGWTAGMALSENDGTLWVASFDANRITEIDTATLSINRTFS